MKEIKFLRKIQHFEEEFSLLEDWLIENQHELKKIDLNKFNRCIWELDVLKIEGDNLVNSKRYKEAIKNYKRAMKLKSMLFGIKKFAKKKDKEPLDKELKILVITFMITIFAAFIPHSLGTLVLSISFSLSLIFLYKIVRISIIPFGFILGLVLIGVGIITIIRIPSDLIFIIAIFCISFTVFSIGIYSIYDTIKYLILKKKSN
ncbi:MAG: hypothetical protein ACFFFB_18980 [Candidatus Heimdallarchaeota archaeon]